VVASLPHGGIEFPETERCGLLVAPDELWTDLATPQLYEFLPGLGIATVVNRLSRFVADPNREIRPPLHGDFWRAAVPSTDTGGRAIYERPLGDQDVARRIAFAHEPYHRSLDRLLYPWTRGATSVLLVDLHSFGMPLGADVIIGDGNGTTAKPEVVDLVQDCFKKQGFRVARNLRFTGGCIVRRFANAPSVDAVQLELHQHTYLTGSPRPVVDPGKFTDTQQRLIDVFAQLSDTYAGQS
jgi:N-formylglutamate deformylase